MGALATDNLEYWKATSQAHRALGKSNHMLAMACAERLILLSADDNLSNRQMDAIGGSLLALAYKSVPVTEIVAERLKHTNPELAIRLIERAAQ